MQIPRPDISLGLSRRVTLSCKSLLDGYESLPRGQIEGKRFLNFLSAPLSRQSTADQPLQHFQKASFTRRRWINRRFDVASSRIENSALSKFWSVSPVLIIHILFRNYFARFKLILELFEYEVIKWTHILRNFEWMARVYYKNHSRDFFRLDIFIMDILCQSVLVYISGYFCTLS